MFPPLYSSSDKKILFEHLLKHASGRDEATLQENGITDLPVNPV